MAIRIYALAKELDIDSKKLVDLCVKAGITGKGSALASLTEEEVTRIRSYLSGPSRSIGGGAPVATAPAAPAPAPARPSPMTRDEFRGPAAATGKVRVLGGRPAKPESVRAPEDKEEGVEKSPARPPASKKEPPVVRVAAIPKSGQSTAPPKQEEPVAQKPIMTLPADAIRGAKSGRRAPLEQFTKQHERKRDVEEVPAEELAEQPQAKTAGKPRRKPGAPRFDEEEDREKRLATLSSARAARQQKRRRVAQLTVGDEDESDSPRRHVRVARRAVSTAAPRKTKVTVSLPCTVRSLSEATGVAAATIQRSLMALGSMVAINAELDRELAELVAVELGLEVELKPEETLEDQILARIAAIEDSPEDLRVRPPVVTFLGHVDHGKTSLLDKILGIDVVSREAGGITQYIRAYQIEKDRRPISFVDTPGHEAFTEMRARGAQVTDIAVLVVAADDGVMPQTEEAISHARAAEVPIVVALNKIDLPNANPTKALQDLAAHGLLPTQWGGDVEVIQTSAATGEGINDLLETILLTAELHEYRANPNRPAMGTCLEAEQQGNRGVVAKVIVQNGTLRVGDVIVCGGAHGRVKAMYETLDVHRLVDQAAPSRPVNLIGLDCPPEAGDAFYVLDDIGEAREIAHHRQQQRRKRSLAGRSVRVSFEEFQRRLEEGRLSRDEDVVMINLILRADVRGSIEAIQKELEKLHHPEVQIRILQASVGGITVADVTLADASDAVILGFNVIPDEAARALADKRGVEIRRYDIIYKVTEDLKALLEGKLKPEEQIKELGRALVQRTFGISRVGTVAGCRVLAGTIERGCRIRVNRDGRGIGDYPLESLRREKDDVREVREGMECGLKLAAFNDVKEGDVLEAYKIEEVARTL